MLEALVFFCGMGIILAAVLAFTVFGLAYELYRWTGR